MNTCVVMCIQINTYDINFVFEEMNTELMTDIKAEISKLYPGDKEYHKKCVKRVKSFFEPGLNDILTTRFKGKKPKISFVGMGGCNIVVRIGTRLFRISYDAAQKSYEPHVRHEFEVLNSGDFGILAPIDYAFKVPNIWWHEIQEAYPYQGATLNEYSKLFHKIIKLAKYNLYWFDVHNGNLMQDKKGRLVVADFDTGNAEYWVKPNVQKNKNIKLSEIKKYLDIYLPDWTVRRDLRFKIYAYINIDVSNENWMKFVFGEFMYTSKYNIQWCYPTSLFEAQVKHKGNIGF